MGDGCRKPEELSEVRVLIARHLAPPPDQKIKVGKRIGKWVYELFLTNPDCWREVKLITLVRFPFVISG